jgi:hypothetical protein
MGKPFRPIAGLLDRYWQPDDATGMSVELPVEQLHLSASPIAFSGIVSPD